MDFRFWQAVFAIARIQGALIFETLIGGQMDYYFSAANEEEALRAKDVAAGPIPGSDDFDSVEAKGVWGTSLEELIAMSKGISSEMKMAGVLPLWPEMPEKPKDFEPGSSLTRLPDSLRDELAELELTHSFVARCE